MRVPGSSEGCLTCLTIYLTIYLLYILLNFLSLDFSRTIIFPNLNDNVW